MSAYVVVEIKVHDPELYTSYTHLTPAIIASYQGKFIARGGDTIVLEGDWQPKRLVLLEFPTLEIANTWWNSKEYSKARAIRQRAATTKMIIIDGV